MPVKAIRVGTSDVPRSFISRTVAALAKVPCSIESTPARTAASMPASAWAWAATLRPSEWAVSTIAFISASVKCWPRPRACCERTPPVAVILMMSAPARETSRTRAAHCSGPVQVLSTLERPDHLGPEAGDVAMAADDRDGRAGGEDSRARDEPFGGGPAKREADQRRRAEVADGGEAGERGDAGVLDAEQGHPFVAVDRLVAKVAAGIAGEMDVHVDQAGQHGLARQVDEPGAGGRRASGRRRRR